MVFHWSLSNSKAPQVSRTLLSILLDFNSAMVWMVSISFPLSLFSRSLGSNYTVTFMFYHFFCSLAKSKYLSVYSLSFSLTQWLTEMAKSTSCQILFTWLINTGSGLLTGIVWTICISKSKRIFWVPYFGTDSGLCIYYLLAWSNFYLLHNSLWITFPTQSCLVSYFFCASLLYLLILVLSLLLPLWVFHTCVNWCSFTEVWVTASLLDSSQYSGQP